MDIFFRTFVDWNKNEQISATNFGFNPRPQGKQATVHFDPYCLNTATKMGLHVIGILLTVSYLRVKLLPDHRAVSSSHKQEIKRYALGRHSRWTAKEVEVDVQYGPTERGVDRAKHSATHFNIASTKHRQYYKDSKGDQGVIIYSALQRKTDARRGWS